MSELVIKKTTTRPVEIEYVKYGYKDIVDEDGALVPPTARRPKRPFEVVEEMYGMIQLLANEIAKTEPISVDEIIKSASENYKRGLELSPTKRYGDLDA